jgi:hypothetical protein
MTTWPADSPVHDTLFGLRPDGLVTHTLAQPPGAVHQEGANQLWPLRKGAFPPERIEGDVSAGTEVAVGLLVVGGASVGGSTEQARRRFTVTLAQAVAAARHHLEDLPPPHRSISSSHFQRAHDEVGA